MLNSAAKSFAFILVTYRTNVLYRPINSILLDDKASTTCTVCNLFYNF